MLKNLCLIIFSFLSFQFADASVGNCYISTHEVAYRIGVHNFKLLEKMYSSSLRSESNQKAFDNHLMNLLSNHYDMKSIDRASVSLRQLLLHRSLQKRGVLAKDLQMPDLVFSNLSEKKVSDSYRTSKGANSQLIAASFDSKNFNLSFKVAQNEKDEKRTHTLSLKHTAYENAKEIRVYWVKHNIIVIASSESVVSRAVYRDGQWQIDRESIMKLPSGLLKLRSFDGKQFISSHQDNRIYFWQNTKAKPILLQGLKPQNPMDPLDFQFLSPRNFTLFSSKQIQFLFVNSKNNELNSYLTTGYSTEAGFYGKDRILKLYVVSDSRVISLHKNGDLKLWSLKDSKFELITQLDDQVQYRADQSFTLD
ncbi:MAG: hypothetical protein CL674_05680 [Bdellovibrionaceae bacterium]|nr:hypothetical protein [Pseudobdellovibrionaceae bacterium]|tara:strand:- start:108244 stop:109338 length:1095 start_codon:yes stop_codon:yes gene_type:complete